ncbi:MAG: sigma-54 dependent transcriptional regulator [Verrucomicrobiia bacterium]
MPFERILVLEDDLIVRKNIEQQLRTRSYEVTAAATLAAAQSELANNSFDLIIADVRLPDGNGTDLLRQLQERPQRPLVIMMSGFGSIESAIECIQCGAFDYLIKPFSSQQLEVSIGKAENFNRLVKVNQHLSHEGEDEGENLLVGKSAAMEQLRLLIRKVARTEATVLIQGESGTGKELVARELYRQSPRANAPFIKLNCAAIPENLIESEFFGHEKGSYTGATAKREGRFELAHGGTLLLDEISEVSLNVQAKLLRVLQEREFERVGGNRTIKVDVRVISTTNRNLDQSVDRKEFRQDLFFRLNVVPVHLSPLREHIEDVPELVASFLPRFARRHGANVSGISAAAMEALVNHSWPGNVRELQNIIERAVILCGEGELQVGHLTFGRATSPANGSAPAQTAASAAPTGADGEFLSLDEIEKRHILVALARCNNNRTHAANLLGISIRTLRNKLNDYQGKS